MLKFLVPAVLLLSTPLLHSQAVEVYGTFTELHATNVPGSGSACPVSEPSCTYTAPFAHVNGLGPAGGITFNFVNAPSIQFGLDFRGSKELTKNGGDTGFIGLKLAGQPHVTRVSLYLEGALGFLRTTESSGASATADNTNYFGVEVVGGVDYPLTRHFDVRILEAGVGHAVSYNYAGTKPTFVTASTGLVYRF